MEGGEIKKTLDYSLCTISQTKSKKMWLKTLYHMKLCLFKSELNMEIGSVLRRGKG